MRKPVVFIHLRAWPSGGFSSRGAHGKGVRRLWPALARRRNAAGGADSILKGEARLRGPNCSRGSVGGGVFFRARQSKGCLGSSRAARLPS